MYGFRCMIPYMVSYINECWLKTDSKNEKVEWNKNNERTRFKYL